MRMRCIVLSLGLVVLMALLPLSVAYADGPVVEGPFHEGGTAELVDCGSFQIPDGYELNYVEKWFFDKR